MSCRRDVSIVFILESDISDPGFLPPHIFLHWGGTWAPGCPLWAALPPGFDRKGQRKAGRPLQTPTKNTLGFLISRAAHHVGAGGTRMIFGNFLEALLTMSQIAVKTFVWG